MESEPKPATCASAKCLRVDEVAGTPARTVGHATVLAQMKRGQSGLIRHSSLDAEDAALLGAMGLCCNAKVRLCRAGEPCIVAVTTGNGAGCRIGLARPLAERIMVDVMSDTSE